MMDADVEHYLAHRNVGDMASLIAYEQLKVIRQICDLLQRQEERMTAAPVPAPPQQRAVYDQYSLTGDDDGQGG